MDRERVATSNVTANETRRWNHEELSLFLSSTFYMDMKQSSAKAFIIKNLLRLGSAKIEEFLSKQVNYIITDRPECYKFSTMHPDSATEGIVSPSPLSTRNSFVGSPFSALSSRNLNDRSALILCKGQEAARRQNKGTSSVIEVAKNWGIPVVSSKRAIVLLNMHLLALKTVSNTSEHMGRDLKENGKRKLCGDYIKVEDVNGYYRPAYKEFHQWPELDYTVHCPFDLQSKRLKGVTKTEVLERKPLVPLNKELPKQSNVKPERVHFRNESKKTELRRKKTLSYCDICSVSYTNLKKHISKPVHQSYMRNSKNYSEVIELMASLPSASINANHEIADSKMNNGKERCLNLSSSISITRRLDSSVTAKHFLSVHDWPVSMSGCLEDRKTVASDAIGPNQQDVLGIDSNEDTIPYCGEFACPDTVESCVQQGSTSMDKLPYSNVEITKVSLVQHSEERVSASCKTDNSNLLYSCVEKTASSEHKKTLWNNKDIGGDTCAGQSTHKQNKRNDSALEGQTEHENTLEMGKECESLTLCRSGQTNIFASLAVEEEKCENRSVDECQQENEQEYEKTGVSLCESQKPKSKAMMQHIHFEQKSGKKAVVETKQENASDGAGNRLQKTDCRRHKATEPFSLSICEEKPLNLSRNLEIPEICSNRQAVECTCVQNVCCPINELLFDVKKNHAYLKTDEDIGSDCSCEWDGTVTDFIFRQVDLKLTNSDPLNLSMRDTS